MKHTSHRFGEFTYEEDQIITFPKGLLGFPEFHKFVLKGNPNTAPICWLLSVEDGGPELALINPVDINSRYSLDDVKLNHELLGELDCSDPDHLLRYAIVTVPENIKQMSMNLQTPVFIDPESRLGLEYPKPGLKKKLIRCLIYRELLASRPEDQPSILVMLRKENETVEIGDEITVQVMEFANGGVRLAVTAPRHMTVDRGQGKVLPDWETQRADTTMDLHRLEGIMHMHRVMQSDEESLKDMLPAQEQINSVAG